MSGATALTTLAPVLWGSSNVTARADARALNVTLPGGALVEAGWTPGKGATEAEVAAAVAALGYTLTATSLTVAAAIADGGTFIVSSFRGRSGHAWVIEAGRVVNALGWDRPGRVRTRYGISRIGD